MKEQDKLTRRIRACEQRLSGLEARMDLLIAMLVSEVIEEETSKRFEDLDLPDIEP